MKFRNNKAEPEPALVSASHHFIKSDSEQPVIDSLNTIDFTHPVPTETDNPLGGVTKERISKCGFKSLFGLPFSLQDQVTIRRNKVHLVSSSLL